MDEITIEEIEQFMAKQESSNFENFAATCKEFTHLSRRVWKKVAQLTYNHSVSKDAVKTMYAKLYIKHKELFRNAKEKATEETVNSVVLLEEEYLSVVKKEHDAKLLLDLWVAEQKFVEQKTSMFIELCKMNSMKNME